MSLQFNILIISLLLTTPLFAEQRLLTHLTAERNDSVWFAELTYNRQNRLLNATITLSVSGENPKNWQRIEQKFDGEKLTSRSQFVWKNGVWANQRRTIWNYSGENIAREIEQIGTVAGWTTIWQTENQFVDNQLKISTLTTTKNGKTRRIRTTFSESNGIETIAFEVDTAGVWQPFGTATLSENSRQKLLTFEQNGQNVSPLRFVTYKNNRGETHQIQTEKGWENLACLVRENGQNGIVWQSVYVWNQRFWSETNRQSRSHESATIYLQRNKEWLPEQTAVTTFNSEGLPIEIENRFEFWGEQWGELTPAWLNVGGKNIWASRITMAYTAVESGIETIAGDAQICVYPNPSPSGIFCINSLNASELRTFRVIDLQGRMLLTQSFDGDTRIDLSELPNGLYLVEIETTNSLITKKLFKD